MQSRLVSDRNISSLLNRIGTIRQEVIKFNGWSIHVQNRKQSGMTFEDRVCMVHLIRSSSCMFHTYLINTYSLLQIIQACSLFKKIENKPFLLLYCWKELRNHPKQLAHLSSQGSASQ